MNRALTLPEAADQLRKSKRWLLEWLRVHPADNDGQPFYTPVGRDKIFHQTDIARIELALRGTCSAAQPQATAHRQNAEL